MSTSEAASVMVESVADFAAKSPTSVKLVTVCIFQASMVPEYTDAVAKKVSPSLLQKAAGSDRLYVS